VMSAIAPPTPTDSRSDHVPTRRPLSAPDAAAAPAPPWHLLAAQAAHQLDPGVALPEPMLDTHTATPDRPLGQAANKRLARLRRRLVGLP
jgi:hypothetical protein